GPGSRRGLQRADEAKRGAEDAAAWNRPTAEHPGEDARGDEASRPLQPPALAGRTVAWPPEKARRPEPGAGEGVVANRGVRLEAGAVGLRLALRDCFGAEPSGEHRGKDPLCSEGMSQPERVTDQERSVAMTEVEVDRIEEVVPMALDVLERVVCAPGDVAAAE